MSHRLQFREDRAALLDRPRFDSRELSCFEPRAELSKRLSQLVGRMGQRDSLSDSRAQALVAAKETEPRFKLPANRNEDRLASRFGRRIEWTHGSDDAPVRY